MSIMLEVRHLQKRYVKRRGFLWRSREEVTALDDVSFRIRQGETFGLLGPNGAGKTTTVNILAGIVLPDSGTIRFMGEELQQEARNRMNVATAFAGLMDELTVFQNLRFFGKLYGVSSVDRRVEELLHRFGIRRLKETRFYRLSSGEKTRVNLCKGLINKPEFLMLDEATAGLDADVAQEVREQIRQLGTTILFTSHNLREVEELCSRVALLSHGRVISRGTPQALARQMKEQLVTIDFYPTRKDLRAALAALPASLVSLDGFHAVLRVPYAERKLHQLLHPLFRKGFLIRDLAIEKPSLEDFFLHTIRKARNRA